MSLRTLASNLRQAARALEKTPAFSITVLLTLALGIGANSAVFSVIDAVLLRPLPFPDADRLILVKQHNPRVSETPVAPTRLTDWSRFNATLQALTGYYTQDDSETSGDLPERLKRGFVAPRFLEVWGVAPVLGRDFRPDEEHFGGPNAVLISDRFWRRRFNADPKALGRRLRVGGYSLAIVGVMPASFAFPDRDVDLWSPSPMDAPFAQDRNETWFTVIARLKPGVTLAQARANLAAVQASLGRQYPKTDSDLSVEVQPLKEVTIGGVRRSLWILFGSVTLLLLIACANIAALLLARATQRRHEISIRYSLGASRAALATHLLIEAFVLALTGAGLGLLLATGAVRAFHALANSLPRIEEINLNWHVVLYSLVCAVGTTVLSGLLPAIRGTDRGLSGSLAQAGRTQVSARRPLQYALVGIQVALAVTLLAGAGLLLRSFQELGRVSPGFDSSHILTFQVSASWGETADMQGLSQRTKRLVDALSATPGVEAAAMGISLPGVPQKFQTEMQLMEGRAETEPKIVAENRAVSPEYFATMQIPVLAGETCRIRPGAPTAVVNRSFARAYLADQAIGRHLKSFANAPPAEIVGVVGDARETGINHEPVPVVYGCYEIAQPGAYFMVRTTAGPAAMAETIRRRIHELEPLRSVFDMMPLEQHFDAAFAENRFRTILLTLFAITAVSLACVGLYGMLNYAVNLRRKEVGLRMALGAGRGQILGRILREGVRVTLIGCVAGLMLALAFSRVLSGMLYGVQAWDLPTLSAVTIAILTVSVAASLLPALRASRVEPVQVLRDE
ncbi:MAG: ABC transporter permease [Bryobacterales bacterium]|nr:ABC transporter permease [Bryobacterales bacterium]MBV9397469.1 ABC transporter permease [Bryobacterales bacterium]